VAEDQLLPAVAAAGAWLGDERGLALLRACAARGLIARHAELNAVDETGVTINYGQHLVRLRGQGDRARLPPLRVEVDGAKLADLRFHRSGLVPGAATVQQLQRAGLRVFLASHRTPAQAARAARQIGADDHAGSLDDHARCDLLRNFHERGSTVLHVRDGPALPHARSGYVSIALAGPDGIRHDADMVLLGRSIAPLPTLVALARDNVAHNRQDRWAVVAPNLAGVAGVFAFGFSGLTVVLISNAATYIAHHRARRALKEAKINSSVGADLPWQTREPGVEAALLMPTTLPEPEQMGAYA
jgi:cation transport ATPase